MKTVIVYTNSMETDSVTLISAEVTKKPPVHVDLFLLCLHEDRNYVFTIRMHSWQNQSPSGIVSSLGYKRESNL